MPVSGLQNFHNFTVRHYCRSPINFVASIPVFALAIGGDYTLRQEKYLEIRSSEVAANKVHKHLQNLLATKPRLYKKSLIRYKDLAYILMDCVDLIIRFLTSNLLSDSGNDEFNELTDIEVDDDVIAIKAKLEESINLLNTYNQLTSGNITQITNNDPDKSKINCAYMAKIYGEVLANATDIDYGYTEINDCAKLINYWYSTRMLHMSTNHKAYNIAQLPNWICYIILMYGKYHANGQTQFFIDTLMKWCNDANEDFSNKYAVPKEITNLSKSSYVNDYTLDALIIYDILMEQGYLPLVLDDNSIVPMNPNFIVDITKENNPNLDKMIKTRFTKREKYIKQIGLTRTSIDTEVEGAKI